MSEREQVWRERIEWQQRYQTNMTWSYDMERFTEEAHSVLQRSFEKSQRDPIMAIIRETLGLYGSCGQRLLTKCQYSNDHRLPDVQCRMQRICDRPLSLTKGIITNAIQKVRSRNGAQWIDTADVIHSVAAVLGESSAQVFDQFSISSRAISETIDKDEIHSLAYLPKRLSVMAAICRGLTLRPQDRAIESEVHSGEAGKR